jgi:hypothetical protein
MKCLNDARIQAVADNEASAEDIAHAVSCATCGRLVRDREARTAAIVSAMNALAPPPQAVSRRVEQTVASGAGTGATRLRNPGSPPRAWRPAVWSAGAVAAATLVVILFVVPMFKGPSTVSASEVLARSAGRLAERLTTGVEYLEYELTLDGMPRELMPDHPDGAYRVKQLIDHDTPGRYYLATYAPDGRVLTALAQDPVAHRRVMTIRVEDQPFRFEVSLPDDMTMSAPEMERLHMQASVTMMQASGNQQLQVIEHGGERQYLIEVPRVSGQALNDIWDLVEARVLIDASDYHIVEFAVKGTFLRQPYSVSYRLISRAIAAQMSVPAGEFEVPDDGGAIRIDGDGSAIPLRDALVLALRELARAKQAHR